MKLTIASDVLAVLDASQIAGNTLVLSGQRLERKLYERTNKVLEMLGGKWNRKQQAHVFEGDPSDAIEAVLVTGEVIDLKKKFQFFPTPKDVVRQMVALAELDASQVIVEPSAGDGAIVAEILSAVPGAHLKIIELDPQKVGRLRAKFGNIAVVIEGDFLQYKGRADRIVMNPPFTGQQDIAHVTHAYSLLNNDGIVVSVVSESPFFRQTKQAVAFRELIEDSEIVDIERGAFHESGTDIKTRVVRISKSGNAREVAA